MKKLFLIIGLLLVGIPTIATEGVTEQTIQNENTYLGVNLQKAPTEPNGKQLITNHKSFLIINIVVNGKVKETDTSKGK